jgi:WD40 repeat protein
VDGTVRLWASPTPGPAERFHHGRHKILAATGRTLAAGGDSSVITLWSVENPKAPQPLTRLVGHDNRIRGIAFSPDGHSLASASDRAPIQLANLTGHTDLVGTAAFAPDGRHLATGSTDRSVRFWLTDPTDAARLICTTSGPTLSADQWAHHANSTPYRQLC